jgi:hypothetical protein
MKNKKDQAEEYLSRIASEVKINNVTFSTLPTPPEYIGNNFQKKEIKAFFELLIKYFQKRSLETKNFYNSESDQIESEIEAVSDYIIKVKSWRHEMTIQNNGQTKGLKIPKDFIYLKSYEMFVDWLKEKQNSLQGASIDESQFKNADGRPCIEIYEKLTPDGIALLHYFSTSYKGGKYGVIEKRQNLNVGKTGYSYNTIYNRYLKISNAQKNYCNFDGADFYNTKKKQLTLIKEKLFKANETEASMMCRDWLITTVENAIKAINERSHKIDKLFRNIEQSDLDELKKEVFLKKTADLKK